MSARGQRARVVLARSTKDPNKQTVYFVKMESKQEFANGDTQCCVYGVATLQPSHNGYQPIFGKYTEPADKHHLDLLKTSIKENKVEFERIKGTHNILFTYAFHSSDSLTGTVYKPDVDLKKVEPLRCPEFSDGPLMLFSDVEGESNQVDCFFNIRSAQKNDCAWYFLGDATDHGPDNETCLRKLCTTPEGTLFAGTRDINHLRCASWPHTLREIMATQPEEGQYSESVIATWEWKDADLDMVPEALCTNPQTIMENTAAAHLLIPHLRKHNPHNTDYKLCKDLSSVGMDYLNKSILAKKTGQYFFMHSTMSPEYPSVEAWNTLWDAFKPTWNGARIKNGAWIGAYKKGPAASDGPSFFNPDFDNTVCTLGG